MLKLLSLSKSALGILGLLSLVVAALQFVVPLYMMAIYNRILQTQSFESLQLISMIAVFLLAIMGIAEIGRSRLLALISKRISSYLNKDVYEAIMATPGSALGQALNLPQNQARLQPIHDLKTVSGFVAQGGVNTFFDAVLAPIFLVALFLLHPWLGLLGITGATTIFALAFAAEILARRNVAEIGKIEGGAQAVLERSLNQYDAVAAMGMSEPLYGRWRTARAISSGKATSAQTVSGILTGLAKSMRLILQMGVLGLGAYLALTTDYFLAGAIIAASIILGRALSPIDQSIGLWRPYVQARLASQRLAQIMETLDQIPPRIDLPKPKPSLTFESVTLLIPNQENPLVQNASFRLTAGDVMGVFGGNGMGKTTFLRAAVGLQAPKLGVIAIGSAPVAGFTPEDRAKYFGYLPQDVQLLPGTIADNIARFREIDKNALFDAVELAGAEDLIQSLPDGYSTNLEEIGLSSGQKQLIGLARAVYGDPILLCMDEPTANLDVFSRQRILRLIEDRKTKGLVTVLVAHEDQILDSCTHLFQMGAQNRRGRARFGEKSEILGALAQEAKKAKKP